MIELGKNNIFKRKNTKKIKSVVYNLDLFPCYETSYDYSFIPCWGTHAHNTHREKESHYVGGHKYVYGREKSWFWSEDMWTGDMKNILRCLQTLIIRIIQNKSIWRHAVWFYLYDILEKTKGQRIDQWLSGAGCGKRGWLQRSHTRKFLWWWNCHVLYCWGGYTRHASKLTDQYTKKEWILLHVNWMNKN